MDFISTFKGSYAGSAYPQGWDYKKIQKITGLLPRDFPKKQTFWNKDFEPIICNDASGGVESMNAMMGYEMFDRIKKASDEKRELAIILPVGPMGMYKWLVYFCKKANLSLKHVHGFNMDEWADAKGNSTPANAPGSFQGAMEKAFYGPMGRLTVPKAQRNFATRKNLPLYGDKIDKLRANGAELVVVYGIGRACHIAFWEPHFASEYKTDSAWRKETHRIGARLHPLTIEQNSLHSFASRMTLIPLFANTIGPALFTKADYCIGGADGAHGPLNWQGQSLWMTLRYGPSRWVPSSWMPTMPGKLFVTKPVVGPLVPDAN